MARTRVSQRRSRAHPGGRKQQRLTSGLDALLAAGRKAAEHSGSALRQSKLASELRAPITIEIEQQLAQLVTQFGAEKVRDALTPLVTNCKWNDWLCVSNAVDRLARRAKKQHEFTSGTSAKSRSKAKKRRTKGH